MRNVLCSLLLIIILAQAVSVPAAHAQGSDAGQPPVAAYDGGIATAWFDLILELTRQGPGFTPPVASRAFGYAGVTLYEALVPGMPGYRSLAGQLNDLPVLSPTADANYHWPLVANSALASISRRLFAGAGGPARTAVDALELNIYNRYETAATPAIRRRSVERGRMVAATIFEWSKHDGGHEGYMFNFPVRYQPPAGEGLWRATPPKYQRALQPYWGANRPLALPTGDACLPPPPPAYSTDPGSAMYAEALEVYDTVSNLTLEQRETALYWADDPTLTATPPGHSLAIATQLLREENATLARAAEGYARLGIGLADAFIANWNAKFHFNRVRPITYIQEVIDPTWNATSVTDPVYTPPFPEYPSGHAAESGAAAVILGTLFGANREFTDRSQARLGFAPRAYPSFWATAEEAAASRLYGGIHFRSGNEQGLTQGKCVGEAVLRLDMGGP
jgi:hypothetical protein